MWLMTDVGFFSVVQSPENPETLVVRARDEGDMQRFANATNLRYQHTPQRDYAFRALASKDTFAKWLADRVFNLNYGNFKGHIASVDKPRATMYGKVWGVMMHLQKTAPWSFTGRKKRR